MDVNADGDWRKNPNIRVLVPALELLKVRAEHYENALITAMCELRRRTICEMSIACIFSVGSSLANKICGVQASREFMKWTPDDMATFGAHFFVHTVWPAYIAQFKTKTAPQHKLNSRKACFSARVCGWQLMNFLLLQRKVDDAS